MKLLRWHNLVFLIGMMHPIALCVYSQNERLYFDLVDLPKTMSPAVRSIVQDHQGLIWVGTEKGLGRYDGYSWRVFHSDATDSFLISDANVWTVFEDRKGYLWIGTINGGVNVLDRNRSRFHHYKHQPNNTASLSNNTVYSILEDNKGVMWIGTENGLNCIYPESNKVMRLPDQTTDPSGYKGKIIHSLAMDSLYRIWIGSDSGLTVYDPQTCQFSVFQVQEHGRIYTPRRVRKLYADEDRQTLWIGTFGGGLYRWGIHTHEIKQYDVKSVENAYPSNYVRNLVTDRDHEHLWIAIRGGGLGRLHKASGQIRYFTRQPNIPLSIPDNASLALYRDDLGSIWVGFNYDGLAIMNYRKSWFQHIRRDATGTLVDHTVRSVCVAGDGTTLFGVQRAVHRYDPHTDRLQSFVMPEHVVNGFNQVQAILYDKGQNYWIGTYGNGLNRLDAATGKFSKYDAYPSGVQQRILSLTRFGDFLWIGTPSEIIRIHPATSSSRIYKNIRAVNSFAQTNTQKLIAGSGTNGLFFYDAVADSFMPWLSSSMKYPSDYETRSLFADSQYIVWQGTSNGLNKINHKTGEITRYTRNDGIPSTDVTGIIQSPDQRLWISTTSGILRLDPGQSQFRYYYKENGLLGNEFSLSAVAMSSEGRIFFGGIQGVTWFNASDVRDYDYKPTLLITKISRFYQDVDGEIPYNSIEAQYNENVLTFEYSVLDYAFSAGIHYAYRLEGFNQTWIQTDERHATFTNLDPGEYVFRVRGTRGDGTWIDSESKVFITIHPPYWLTWWFWSLVVFCIGMVTWMGYRMRVRSLLRRKRELQTEVERQTKELYAKNIELQSLNDTKNEFLGMAAHDLRNPLGAVGNIAELMLFEMNPENPETKQTFSDLNRIIQLTERMSYLIHELLDYSAIESGKVSLAVDTIDWTVLVHEVCEMNERAASRKKIVIKKEFSDGTIVLHGDRMRLMSVLDNLVSNAIKYSFAGTEVLIRSEVANRKLRVTVYDHGQGLPEADVARAFKSFQKLSAKPTGGESSTGLGLAIIKKIIDLHAGQVWLESELHKGSTFGFSLPLERPFSD